MPAFVRTPRDEAAWALAKSRALSAGKTEGTPEYRAYVNAAFKRARPPMRRGGGIATYLRHGTVRFAKGQPKDILEHLAALEHEQWMHWTKALAERGVVGAAQVKKWRVNWCPYEELSDETKEQDRVWARRALARMREGGLAKGFKNKPFTVDRSAKMMERKPFEPKGSLDEMSGQAVLDSHALVQRPDHRAPVTGRVTAVGRDGIHLRDDGGKVHRVRHEHVLDHQPPVGEEEWAEAAQALHRQGVPVDVEERFGKKVSPRNEALLGALDESGVPIDTERLTKEGSADDISEVVRRNVNEEPKPSQLPTVVSADRQRQAPGWEKVYPEGKGRVSRQKRSPKRIYAEDNDTERDSLFDAVKDTGMVSKVRISPEADESEQEHLLRYATNALKSIAEVVGPPNNPPILVINPAGVNAEGEEPGAHYNRRANALEVSVGDSESITHAYGHVFDAAFGDGQYASTQKDGVLSKLMASLSQAKGTGDLDVSLATAERREEEAPDSPRRFWTGPAEVFARFFEQYVDSSLGEGKPQPHHEYVRGVEQPGSLDANEMAVASEELRRLLGSRNKRASGVRKITARQPRPAAKADEMRPHLLEEAKAGKTDASRRMVSALTHGVHSRHVTKAPGHYSDEEAAEHRALVRRAKGRMTNGRSGVQPQRDDVPRDRGDDEEGGLRGL